MSNRVECPNRVVNGCRVGGKVPSLKFGKHFKNKLRHISRKDLKRMGQEHWHPE